MAFFEPPPPPPPPPPDAFRRPKWMRPEHVLGEPVPLTLLLARSAKAAIQVGHLTAFPNGFEFRVVAHCRTTEAGWDSMHGLAGFHPGRRGGTMDDDILRFGIEYADGAKATNLGRPMMGPDDERQKGPMLQPMGGGSGNSVAEQTYWAWPLPPAGSLAFVCEWPKYSISLTRKEIQADLILEAASRATELWPDDSSDDRPDGGGASSWSAATGR